MKPRLKRILLSLVGIGISGIILGIWSSGLPTGLEAFPRASEKFEADKGASTKSKYGGTLRIIGGMLARVMWPPEMAPSDSIMTLPATGRGLCRWGMPGKEDFYVPDMAESWEIDPRKKTLIWRLRKGISFQDGTPFNAEAVKWNYEIRIEEGRLLEGANIIGIDTPDEYTVILQLKDIFNPYAMLEYYGHVQMISPTSVKKNGIEWARRNIIGAGPFVLTEFRRDDYMKFVKNENYWKKGLPYLDAIEARLILDSMTARAMMEAGEADVWHSTSDIEAITDLEKKGFKVNYAPGFFYALLPDSSDPTSPFADKRVREAVEYALDRPKIAEMIGRGKYEPMNQLVHSASAAYVHGFDPRPYNPKKARELLAEAGYPRGFRTTLLVRQGTQDLGAAIQAYLAQVGIQAEIDLCDPGRYNAAVFGQGWKGLALAASGINPVPNEIFIHFGPRPLTYRTGTFKKSERFLELCEKAYRTLDINEYLELLKEAIKQASYDCMVIPVLRAPYANVMQPYVHSDWPLIHMIIWTPEDDWMEK